MCTVSSLHPKTRPPELQRASMHKHYEISFRITLHPYLLGLQLIPDTQEGEGGLSGPRFWGTGEAPAYRVGMRCALWKQQICCPQFWSDIPISPPPRNLWTTSATIHQSKKKKKNAEKDPSIYISRTTLPFETVFGQRNSAELSTRIVLLRRGGKITGGTLSKQINKAA